MIRSLSHAVVLAATATALLAPFASAATVSGTPTGADAASAAEVARGQDAWLGRFFVNAEEQAAPEGRRKVLADVSEEAAKAKAPRVDGRAYPIYLVSPGFIRSTTPTDTVADFAHFAVPATSATGQQASMWVAKDANGGWLVENITTGVEETTFPARAEGIVFTEPQINAWYELRGDTVIALNNEAKTSIGESTTVAKYHGMVHARYADKLPGTDYADKGMLGGFSPESHSIAQTASSSTTDNSGVWLGGLALVALIGGAVYVRRTVFPTTQA